MMKKSVFCLIIAVITVLIFGCAFDKAEKTQETPAAGMANPWVETDADGLMETLGLEFNVPEDAEDVVYRMNESEQLAEMKFVLNDMPFTARIKPSALEMEDITGMHYKWDVEEESDAHWTREKIMQAKDGENTVEAILWFDIVPGLTYSLSTKAPDLDGFDIVAVAQMVWHQVQGDN
ncbi:MAG: hypothetical protein IKP86_06570 [Anaerolineaceae bacterium]|nr:hypothetical protein [Anaerolineaceae bacterium]